MNWPAVLPNHKQWYIEPYSLMTCALVVLHCSFQFFVSQSLLPHFLNHKFCEANPNVKIWNGNLSTLQRELVKIYHALHAPLILFVSTERFSNALVTSSSSMFFVCATKRRIIKYWLKEGNSRQCCCQCLYQPCHACSCNLHLLQNPCFLSTP